MDGTGSAIVCSASTKQVRWVKVHGFLCENSESESFNRSSSIIGDGSLLSLERDQRPRNQDRSTRVLKLERGRLRRSPLSSPAAMKIETGHLLRLG